MIQRLLQAEQGQCQSQFEVFGDRVYPRTQPSMASSSTIRKTSPPPKRLSLPPIKIKVAPIELAPREG
jgi:hypothetical protein